MKRSTHLYLTATSATNPDLFALREVPGQPSVLLPCVRSHRVIDPMTMVADLCKRYNVCVYGPVDLLKVNDSPLNTVWALRATYGTLDTLKPVGVSTLSLKETLDRLLVEFGFFGKFQESMDASSWAVFRSWLRATVGSAKNPKINQQTVNELACILLGDLPADVVYEIERGPAAEVATSEPA